MRGVVVGVVAVAACGGDTVAPPSPPAPPAPAPPAPAVVPAAAAAFAATLSPDVVGTLAPGAPVVGDYAMSLRTTFDTFVTTEWHLHDTVVGDMRLQLTADGRARACVRAHAVNDSEGQTEYRPKPDNNHAHTDSVFVTGLAGTWSATQGVATIRFDQAAWSCTLADATPLDPPTELRCTSAGPAPSRLPPNSAACELAPKADGRAAMIGTPMTIAGRDIHRRHDLRGSELVLAPPPGVAVTVVQDRRATLPAFTFATPAERLGDPEFVPRPPKP